LPKALPSDMPRHWVIAISGVAGILWYIFIDRSLKAWALGGPE
jgi:hypothetical protein